MTGKTRFVPDYSIGDQFTADNEVGITIHDTSGTKVCFIPLGEGRTRWPAITVDKGKWSVCVVSDFSLDGMRQRFLECHGGAEIIDDSIGLFPDGTREFPLPDEED
jgi:hypothetical protein